MKLQSGFVGYPDKNSRATAFAGTNWQQAMIAHLWVADAERDLLQIDPASGINANNQLATTTYNDFSHLTWLGARPGVTRLVAGQWYCIEAHAKLNTSGVANGIHEFWINGNLEASRSDLNWIGTWTGYGINAVLLEAYWNAWSPAMQERYFDDFVISTQRIGCTAAAPPSAPMGLTVQ